MEREVSIEVNGKEVPLNDFLRELAEGLVRAIVAPLKGTDPEGEIHITIGARDTKEKQTVQEER